MKIVMLIEITTLEPYTNTTKLLILDSKHLKKELIKMRFSHCF